MFKTWTHKRRLRREIDELQKQGLDRAAIFRILSRREPDLELLGTTLSSYPETSHFKTHRHLLRLCVFMNLLALVLVPLLIPQHLNLLLMALIPSLAWSYPNLRKGFDTSLLTAATTNVVLIFFLAEGVSSWDVSCVLALGELVLATALSLRAYQQLHKPTLSSIVRPDWNPRARLPSFMLDRKR